MLQYEQNQNPVNSARAAQEFIKYAELVGAIKADSVFLRESLAEMLSRNSETEIEKFNRLTTRSLFYESTRVSPENCTKIEVRNG